MQTSSLDRPRQLSSGVRLLRSGRRRGQISVHGAKPSGGSRDRCWTRTGMVLGLQTVLASHVRFPRKRRASCVMCRVTAVFGVHDGGKQTRGLARYLGEGGAYLGNLSPSSPRKGQVDPTLLPRLSRYVPAVTKVLRTCLDRYLGIRRPR
ncbi:uncharacterized protein LY79DRAFT_118892 [Colletotrichum navitas]|uniref:Uncharacterized protein n=1 Tax=Colletotrichum navitas TaxID=681940 RepID=A0AAD8Q435_9PEZI|nr:uncharacterized protein LY79DRAFT_118892 [Colletotrichum navitas]KAK1595108.1 hypothetical protein LY79DRAFT_118892 [Colletotrichum navitas]